MNRGIINCSPISHSRQKFTNAANLTVLYATGNNVLKGSQVWGDIECQPMKRYPSRNTNSNGS